jgi:muramidase (phage lysozyme)
MLAVSELGARLLAVSDDGYNVLVGSTWSHPHLFASYADHPRTLVPLPNLGIKSSAAGRYQFLERTWDGLQPSLGGRVAFDPINQDRACIELLRECRAYPLIVSGSIEGAITAARKTWASLPGAGYGQHEHSMSDLLGVFDGRLAHYRADFANVQAGSATTAPKGES